MNDLHFGVTVGIDRYPGFPGKDLGSARRDAAAFHGWLTDPAGGAVPPENARLIAVDESVAFASRSAGRPTIAEVDETLHEFNNRLRAHPTARTTDWDRTRVYIYVAGHGISTGHGQAALLMANADRDLLRYHMELSRYADWYLQCALVHEVLVFADCCREVPGAPEDPVGVPFTTCALGPSGTKVLLAYAARLGEQAWEPTSMGERDAARGYFTSALLDGLRGQAPIDPATGAITAASLATYVQDEVQRRTKDTAPYRQVGEWPGDLAIASSILFGRPAGAPPARARRVAAIHPPAGLTGGLVLLDDQEVEQARWKPTDAVPWQVLLPEGLYEVRRDPADASAPSLASDGLFRLRGEDADVRL